jgi:hypothetical protein
MYEKTKGTTRIIKPKVNKELPVDPIHMNFLNLVQKAVRRLQICLKEYTMKLSFFLGAGLVAA